jgi:hypothetical protein
MSTNVSSSSGAGGQSVIFAINPEHRGSRLETQTDRRDEVRVAFE